MKREGPRERLLRVRERLEFRKQYSVIRGQELEEKTGHEFHELTRPFPCHARESGHPDERAFRIMKAGFPRARE